MEKKEKIKKIFKEEIKSQMMQVKGGEFPEWYDSLNKEQKEIYGEVLTELNEKREA